MIESEKDICFNTLSANDQLTTYLKQHNVPDSAIDFIRVLPCLLSPALPLPELSGSVQTLLHEATAQAIQVLVWDCFSRQNTGQECLAQQSMQMYAALESNTKNFAAHTFVHETLTNAHIPYVILKGCSSASYYPSPMLRRMGDVDFLVPMEYKEQTRQLFKNLGYREWAEHHHAHLCLDKEGEVHLELHFAINGMPENWAKEVIESQLEDIFATSQLVEIEPFTFIKPDDYHHLLIILVHTYHHMASSGIGLRQMMDLACFFQHTNNSQMLAWKEDLAAAGLWNFTRIMGLFAWRVFGIDYQKWMAASPEDIELADAIVCDILESGNFGRKDEERAFQSMTMENDGVDSQSKSRIGTSS